MNESKLTNAENARDALHFLIHKLDIVSAGPLNETQQPETFAILLEHWHKIAGANETGMADFKLDRSQEVPPCRIFSLNRSHAAPGNLISIFTNPASFSISRNMRFNSIPMITLGSAASSVLAIGVAPLELHRES